MTGTSAAPGPEVVDRGPGGAGPDVAVVYVHGLWLGGRESWLLRRRLAAWHGCPAHVFRYSSMRENVDGIVERLRGFLDTVHAQRLHLLGHSLGGLIILRCLRRYPLTIPGRVVFMGTPVNGYSAARGLGRSRIGRRLLGPVLPAAALAEGERFWDVDRPLGLIAGSASLGMGRLVVEFDGPNDGTVSVGETRLRGAVAHLTLPVTHMGMLLSARVVREVWSFFEHGHFT